jgi:protein SCO1/2
MIFDPACGCRRHGRSRAWPAGRLQPGPGLEFKYGKNMSNEILGRKFSLKDPQGNVRTLSSFYGSMPMIFFGFTQCPAVCPTTLARAAQIRKLLGP